MKKLLTYLTIALSLIIGFGINVKAKPSTHQLIISMTKDGYDIPEENPFGYRMPPVPISCTIDFTTLSITSYRVPEVTVYQLCDETGNYDDIF